MTSPRQAGSDTSVSVLNKGLSVLGGLVLFWLVVGSVVWIFTWDGSSGGEGSQPGVSINSTTPSQPGVFNGTTSQSQPGVLGNTSSTQQQPQPGSTNEQTYTIPAQK